MITDHKPAFQKALDILLSLGKKELFATRYYNEITGCFCAVGAIANQYKLIHRFEPNNAMIVGAIYRHLSSSDASEFISDFPSKVLEMIQMENDAFSEGENGSWVRKDRYNHMVNFLKARS